MPPIACPRVWPIWTEAVYGRRARELIPPLPRPRLLRQCGGTFSLPAKSGCQSGRSPAQPTRWPPPPALRKSAKRCPPRGSSAEGRPRPRSTREASDRRPAFYLPLHFSWARPDARRFELLPVLRKHPRPSHLSTATIGHLSNVDGPRHIPVLVPKEYRHLVHTLPGEQCATRDGVPEAVHGRNRGARDRN